LSVLDFLKRVSEPISRISRRPPPANDEELFDDDFQRKLDYLAIVSRRVFAGRLRAERRTKKSGSGVEFADHRDYVPGDDFRYLDWNVYQRFGRLLVRLYEEEEDLSIYLVIDSSSSMGFPSKRKFRYAQRLAAALAYVGLANLDRITIVATTDRAAPDEASMLMNIMPILSPRRSAGINHNIAQERQEKDCHGCCTSQRAGGQPPRRLRQHQRLALDLVHRVLELGAAD